MFADNTLTPKEAIRLCALGTLAQEPMRYSELAGSVRRFIGHTLGPSLDLMGTSVELLIYEGLVEPLDGEGMADDAELAITDDGRAELHTLLTARLRSGAAELNKLIMTLKFRFLHLLERADRAVQADHLIEVGENELARLDDLRAFHAEDDGHLVEWLDHDIEQVERRLDWLRTFRAGLDA